MHSRCFLDTVASMCAEVDDQQISSMAIQIASVSDCGGRLFILGLGGSAANASHAVNDFRKLCGVRAYAPTDNVAELTARGNDNGWDTIFSDWLREEGLTNKDAILVLSVSGGLLGVSGSIIRAVDLAVLRNALILGIVGRSDGYTAQHGDNVIVLPIVSSEWRTPLAESFQAIIWHCIVNHPALKR